MEFVYYFVGMVIITICFAIFTSNDSPKEKKPLPADQLPKVKLLGIDADPYEDTIRCNIAGAKYRVAKDDTGGFVGFAVPEPTNIKDPSAVKIIDWSGRHIGYLPKDNTGEFHKYYGGPSPVAGYTFVGDEGHVVGGMRVIRPANLKFVVEQIVDFETYVAKNKDRSCVFTAIEAYVGLLDQICVGERMPQPVLTR